MCLTIDKKLTAEYREKYKGQEFEVFKRFDKHNNKLVTPFQFKVVKPGILKANRMNLIGRFIEKYLMNSVGSGAIHTYAENYNGIHRRFNEMIKCKVHIDDLIAAGHFSGDISLGFKKIYIPQEEYDKVLNNFGAYLGKPVDIS